MIIKIQRILKNISCNLVNGILYFFCFLGFGHVVTQAIVSLLKYVSAPKFILDIFSRIENSFISYLIVVSFIASIIIKKYVLLNVKECYLVSQEENWLKSKKLLISTIAFSLLNTLIVRTILVFVILPNEPKYKIILSTLGIVISLFSFILGLIMSYIILIALVKFSSKVYYKDFVMMSGITKSFFNNDKSTDDEETVINEDEKDNKNKIN